MGFEELEKYKKEHSLGGGIEKAETTKTKRQIECVRTNEFII